MCISQISLRYANMSLNLWIRTLKKWKFASTFTTYSLNNVISCLCVFSASFKEICCFYPYFSQKLPANKICENIRLFFLQDNCCYQRKQAVFLFCINWSTSQCARILSLQRLAAFLRIHDLWPKQTTFKECSEILPKAITALMSTWDASDSWNVHFSLNVSLMFHLTELSKNGMFFSLTLWFVGDCFRFAKQDNFHFSLNISLFFLPAPLGWAQVPSWSGPPLWTCFYVEQQLLRDDPRYYFKDWAFIIIHIYSFSHYFHKSGFLISTPFVSLILFFYLCN